MIKPLTLLLTLVSLPAFGATIGSTGNGTTNDGNNQHFILLSTNAYTPTGAETVDSWSVEVDQANPGAPATTGTAVPLIFTSTGGDAGPFTIFASGPSATATGTYAWGQSLTAGTDYYFGFSADKNIVEFGNVGGAIPMTDAWIQGTNTNPPAVGTSGPTGGGDHFGGTGYNYFDEGLLGPRDYNLSFEVNAIPEPSAALLSLFGFGLFLRRRR